MENTEPLSERRRLEDLLFKAERDLSIAQAANLQKRSELDGNAAMYLELQTVYRFSIFIAVIALLTFSGLTIGLIISLKYTKGNTKTTMTIVFTVLCLLGLLGVFAAIWRSMNANKRLLQVPVS